jgi:ABC-type transport system involved in multi-copper enzyme maturation permease subunit
MTLYTIREALSKKVFVFFFIISVLILVVLGLVFGFLQTNSILNTFNPSLDQFQAVNFVTELELIIISPLANLCLLLAIFSSANFVPSMLEKGNIDLLISKPVSRQQLIWGKFLGGLLIVLVEVAFLILGVWLIISIKFSTWNFNVLNTIWIITFTFAVLYSVIVLFGVMTQSSIFGMMIAYFIFLIVSPILLAFNDNRLPFVTSDIVKQVLKGLYYFFPKTSELMVNIFNASASGAGIQNFQPLVSSFIFLLLMMFLSGTVFNKKDF